MRLIASYGWPLYSRFFFFQALQSKVGAALWHEHSEG